MLEVVSRTPGYLVKEELQRKKLKDRAERRVWGFKNKLDEERSELARNCRKEMKER